MRKFFLLLYLLTVPLKHYAQKVYTLEECIQSAKQDNLEIKKAEIKRDQSEINLQDSKGRLLPTLNAFTSEDINFGRTIDPFTNQIIVNNVSINNYGIYSSVTLFNGFQNINGIQLSKYELLASEYDLEFIKNNIGLQVTSVYLDILFGEELIGIAQEQIKLTTEQLRRVKEMIESGKLSPLLMPDLEAQLASEEVRLVRAQNDVRLAYIYLAQLMNVSQEVSFKIREPDILYSIDTNLISNPGIVYQKGLATLPEIKSAEYRIKSSDSYLSMMRGRRSPYINLNTSLRTLYANTIYQISGYKNEGYRFVGLTTSSDSVFSPISQPIEQRKPYGSQLIDNHNAYIGLSLTIPILNQFQVRNSIERAKLTLQESKINLEIEKNKLERKVIAANVDAQNAYKRMQASAIGVKASQEALRNAEVRLELGRINSFEYGQVKNRLVQSNSEHLQAKYEYIFKTKILEFYNGKPLGE